MREYFIWLLKFVSAIVILTIALPWFLVLAISTGMGTIQSTTESGPIKEKVAVVELTGIIDGSKDVIDDLYSQADNKDIKAIVLRINSPGGAVGPSQDVYNAVKKLKSKKPIVASMESLAASGGLYSALSASKIYAEPGTLTGSIGVILEIPNFTRMAEIVKFDMMTIKSGQFKDVGNTFRAMTEEDKNILQSVVSGAYEDFVSAVAEGRKLKVDDVRAFADGRVITGSEAKKLRLVDEFGDIYDAAAAALDLAGVKLPPGETPELVYSEDKWATIKEVLNSATSFSIKNALRPSMRLSYIMN